MSRFTMTLLAAAAAAVAAIAVVALPAIGDSGANGQQPNPPVSDFAACLRAHGLPGAPTTDLALKPWLASKQAADPRVVTAAADACKRSAASGGLPDFEALIACVRRHGIDAPAAPQDFKRWLGEQQQASASGALKHALIDCKLAQAPDARYAGPGKPAYGAAVDKVPPCAIKPETPRGTSGT